VEALLYSISIIQLVWINNARDEWKNDNEVLELIQNIQQDPRVSDTFSSKNDALWYEDRLYICRNYQLKEKILMELHTSPLEGQSGFLRTYHTVKKDFFWDELKSYIQNIAVECLV